MTATTDGLFDPAPYTEAFKLADRFGVPPFSTLDTRSGRWRERRARWDTIDLSSTAGRADALTFSTSAGQAHEITQRMMQGGGLTSTFDPVLCELIYRWWTPADGRILDPFAGGSVRGIVAGILGRSYDGIDLSREQCEANVCTQVRLDEYLRAPVRWHVGDAAEAFGSMPYLPGGQYDAVVTCPPYGTLERYTDDPRDLSTMRADIFEPAYRKAIRNAISRLRDHRFAVFVVGNYREGDRLVDLAGMTVRALEDAGARYYAGLVLLNATTSAGIRASAQFNSGRKPTTVHQHVVVAVKGDWRKAAAAAERVDPLDIANQPDEEQP
jgi:hypothetical protein